MSKSAKARLAWIIAAGCTILGSGIAAAAWNYRIYSWSDYEVYGYMENECHPAWREFNFRRIGPGADLSEVVKSTNPPHVDRYGDFVVLSYQGGGYFTGLGATAYKGRLVEAGAWSCCWSKTFFDVRTKEEMDLWKQEWETHMKPLRERWDRELAEEKLKEDQNVPRNDIDP